MHVGLRSVLQIEDQSAIPDPLTDSAQLKHFAREAEVNGNFELAVRLVNQLRGEPRKVASDWLKEARLTMEAKQAAQCLMAHSASAGLTNLL